MKQKFSTRPIVLENIPNSGVGQFIVDLAKQHNVAYVRTALDELADVITRLSDDDVETDEIDHLLIALKRAGVISSGDLVTLLGNYLDEKKNS